MEFIGMAKEITAREVEVLQAMADGMGNEEIGAILFISADTVKVHAKRISIKLGVTGRCSTRAASVAEAFRRGLIT